MNPNRFIIEFQTSTFDDLDMFALLASEDYNLGNQNEWFMCFRGGLYGIYARLYGVSTNFLTVHEWLPKIRSLAETECLISQIFFNKDSAIECFTFAINALGYSFINTDFKNVADPRQLKQISPSNIIGASAMPGYGKIFSKFQTHWKDNESMISRIMEQHDVSKHRETIDVGGQHRKDPPEKFFEKYGLRDSIAQSELTGIYFNPAPRLSLLPLTPAAFIAPLDPLNLRGEIKL